MNDLLVYAKPLTAVDQIVSLDRAGIVGRKIIHQSEDYFRGHYPDYAIYPGVFVVESVQQTARFYLKEFGYQARLIDVRTRFLAAVRPGDTIELHLQCKLVNDGNELRVTGKCMKGDVEASSVKLIHVLGISHEN